MNENINSDVTIQDAKILHDMGMITSEEFALFSRVKALMIKKAVKQYNEYLSTYMENKIEDENSIPSNVIS